MSVPITASEDGVQVVPQNSTDHAQPTFVYQRSKLGPFKLPPYRSGSFQLGILAIIFLLGPGLFAALIGLGGAGLGNPIPVNNSYIINYGTSAAVGFFAGPVMQRIGLRLSLSLGAAAFTFYSATLLIYKRTQEGWVLLLGGAVLGVFSSFSWTAQGTMLLSYPLANSKGKHISLNLAGFNAGASLGSIVVFAQNVHSAQADVNEATYITFIAVMALGIALSLIILEMRDVIRSDGSQASAYVPLVTITKTLHKFFRRLKTDPHIIALFPMMFASNFYLPYIFNDVNLARFNVRTRALNVVLFYTVGILGAYFAGILLDIKRLSLATRVKWGLVQLLILFVAIFAGAYAWQHSIPRKATETLGFHLIDCTDWDFVPPLFLFLSFGFTHFVFQGTIYWFMATLADKSATASTSDFSGYFKSLQSVGAAVSWAVSNAQLEFNTDLAISGGLVIGSVVAAAPILIRRTAKRS
ncbi:major facilitator superfamily domain-containing protein [Xylaria sp. FL0043]|nr:major facilitator superfamily domain-containing protein [Xylaria sp. FL0043]